MVKILQIVDTYDWAIGTLAKAVVRGNPQFRWEQLAVHPKDLEAGRVDLAPIVEAIGRADLVEVQYWRTLSQLLEKVPDALAGKKIVLTHHNEKNLLSYPWPANVTHVAKTRHSEQVLREAYPDARIEYIPNSFDPDRFRYIESFPPEEKAVGYVGRIAPWKGLKEVARACRELGYPLYVMGKHDKRDYFDSIPQEDRDNIRWDFFNCEADDQTKIYEHVTCYVGNSGSGREVGTLGFIEAAARGVPIVTTPAGLAADIGEDGENCLLVDYDDYDQLKASIERMLESPQLQQRLRKNMWDTIRHFTDQRMAWQYRELLNELLLGGDIVSVVIPCTPKDLELVLGILEALEGQTHRAVEAIVVIDQSDGFSDQFCDAIRASRSIPVHLLCTHMTGGYNLAKARNLGVIEASGDYLMLCDARMRPEPDAVETMLRALQSSPADRPWVFGEKGGGKESFVENFSMVRRQHLIEAGMFNERIDAYGGMSQELRVRFSRQGFTFGYIPDARAVEQRKSGLTPAKRDGIIRMKDLLWKLKLGR